MHCKQIGHGRSWQQDQIMMNLNQFTLSTCPILSLEASCFKFVNTAIPNNEPTKFCIIQWKIRYPNQTGKRENKNQLLDKLLQLLQSFRPKRTLYTECSKRHRKFLHNIKIPVVKLCFKQSDSSFTDNPSIPFTRSFGFLWCSYQGNQSTKRLTKTKAYTVWCQQMRHHK